MSSTILKIECEDQKGLVACITGLLHHLDLNIVSNHEFVAHEETRFFMRTEVEGDLDADELVQKLETLLPEGALIEVPARRKKRILIMGTKEAHCLGDLLIRCSYEEMQAEIQAVICNHNKLGSLVEKFEIPFHCISHEGKERDEHEKEMLTCINQYKPDYLVMAKYMRILTSRFVEAFPFRMINIHHSFLPAFIGANPYRQAYERGVKIIGATAHFITKNLDEGPIIAQSVNSVEHQHGPKDLSRAGKDIEKIVLARALSLVLEDRVFVSGNKTIIFD